MLAYCDAKNAKNSCQTFNQRIENNLSTFFHTDENSAPLSLIEYLPTIRQVATGTTFYISTAPSPLYKNIFSLLDILYERGMRAYITTNGLLLNKYVEKIFKYPIENLVFQ